MSQSKQSDQQEDRSEIKLASERALIAWNQFERAQRQVARQGGNPDADKTVSEQHDLLHSAVMSFYNILRSQIRDQLPEIWNGIDIYRDPETGEVLIEGLKSLENIRGRVEETSKTVETRYGSNHVESSFEPVSLPPQAYLRIIDVLHDAMLHLGHTNPPKTRSYVSEMEGNPDEDEEDDDE